MGTITINNQAKPNIPPTVNAGVDQAINLPSTEVSLLATAGDADGIVTSIQWNKVAGGTGIITNPTSLSTTITGLQIGTYTFQIVVFDNYGDSATDTVNIVVNTYKIFPFKWVTNSVRCQPSSNGGYTGLVEILTLKKVTDDGNNYPLDINNQRVSETGLPQAVKNNTMGEAGYVAPYEDLTACPRGRFYSVLSSSRSWNGTVTHPDGGVVCGQDVHSGSMDNASVIENTLPGAVLKNFNNPNGVLHVIPNGGNYYIQVIGNGSASMAFSNSSTQFIAALDLIMQINNTQYTLSPITSTQYGCPTQYRLSKLNEEGNGPSFGWNVNLLLPSLALAAGDVIDMYFRIRIYGSNNYAGRNGTANVTLDSLSIEIKQI